MELKGSFRGVQGYRPKIVTEKKKYEKGLVRIKKKETIFLIAKLAQRIQQLSDLFNLMFGQCEYLLPANVSSLLSLKVPPR